MIREYDTIAAIATPVSNQGIGVIRISGEKSMDIISKIFVPYNKKVNVQTLETHRIYYGNIVDGAEIIDECIVLIMKGPHSYTKEDVVEIDCHGGVQVMGAVLKLVMKQGARPAEPGEFTKRAFLNGRIDLSQAEAVMDLIDSKNESARKNSMAQLKGNLSEQISALRGEIIYQTAYIESALDDPEHISLDGYSEELLTHVDNWINKVQKMSDTYDNGRIISEGIRTCIVGKPNAGKSSLLNALLGEERAIVTDVAGTTRDTLEETINIDGITLRMVDTAGIRDTDDQVEKIGVQKARKEIDQADLILYIADTTAGLDEEDQDILRQIKGRRKIVLLNKNDMTTDFDSSILKEYLQEEDPVISISAKYHQGIDIFINELKNMMFHGKLDSDQEIMITNERHKNALEECLNSLQCVKGSIQDGMPEDFFTIDLTNAYESLGYIIGESLEDDLVNEIFSRFCTGK